MQTAAKKQQKQGSYEGLSAAELLMLLEQKDRLIREKDEAVAAINLVVDAKNHAIDTKNHIIREQQKRIELIEEYLRLARIQRFGSSSEKLAFQAELFDEVELEIALGDIETQLPEDDETVQKTRPKSKSRQGFSDKLPRVQVHLPLSDEEKAGATSTFFTKVKEELDIIPAQSRVIEYWQEKAVFDQDNGEQLIKAAERPIHPLGKCRASVALLAHIIVSKYADALPLYRLETMLQRYGGEITRTAMANWIIGLESVFKPLMNLMREHQLQADYLQADETRIQVLKETGKKATSDKWMWVIRGGPPEQPVVLFDYNPSREADVITQLLAGFQGILQADGYSGYNDICKKNGIRRIGCMDHARRKFVEASKAAPTKKKSNGVSKADVALGMIRKLYRIEEYIEHLEPAQKRDKRQELSVPVLEDLKLWLEANESRVPKDSLTRKAITYMRNQWEYLVYYCEDGRLSISNVLAENAIRPFAVGRKNWLFSDTPRGAKASATCYSLIETAKANGIEPYRYILHVLTNIGAADTVGKLEALLPWNVDLEKNRAEAITQLDC